MRVLSLFSKGIAGALVCALLIEIVLQILPTSTATRMGYTVDPIVMTYPQNSGFQTSHGWDMRDPIAHRTNSVGFLTNHERDRSRVGLGLIGDSFVEGTAVPESQRVTERLRSRLSQMDVLMLGSPGTSLIDYVDRAQWAVDKMDVKRFVFFVAMNDANEAVCGSGQHLRRCVHRENHTLVEMPTKERSAVRDFLARSATLQYFLGHLKLTPDAIRASLFPRAVTQSRETPPTASIKGALRSPASSVAIEMFLARIKALPAAQSMIVLDCDRPMVYSGKTYAEPETYAELKRRNQAYSIPIVELCPRFVDEFKASGAHTEVSLTDTHWNARGHEIVARFVAEQWKKLYQ